MRGSEMLKKSLIILTALSPITVFSEDLSKMFPGVKPNKDCEAIYNEVLEEAKSGKYWYTHVEMISSFTDKPHGKAYCDMRLHGYDKNRGRNTSRPIQEIVSLKGK